MSATDVTKIRKTEETGGVGNETGERKGEVRQVRSEQLMRSQSRSSEGSEQEKKDEEDNGSSGSERLQTPSPATGQLRTEGEEATDAVSPGEATSSPSLARKTIYPKEKKRFFKRPSKQKFGSDSPKPSPKHQAENMSDDRSISPSFEEKHKRKYKSFKKLARRIKKKHASAKRSFSEEKDDTDGDSFHPSEDGLEEEDEAVVLEEEEEEEEEEGVKEDGRTESGETPKHNETPSRPQTTPQRPVTLAKTPSQLYKGNKSVKASKSFNYHEKKNVIAPTPSESPKKSLLRNISRRTSAPGNYRISLVTPMTPAKAGGIVGSPASPDTPLTPIVEVYPPEAPQSEKGDSVFLTEEEIFGVQQIDCCMWGQWMCVSNVGGHVLAFNFQMDERQTSPKVREGERELGRRGRREGGTEGGTEGGRDGGRDRGRERGREGGTEGGREGGRDRGRERGRDGGRDRGTVGWEQKWRSYIHMYS